MAAGWLLELQVGSRMRHAQVSVAASVIARLLTRCPLPFSFCPMCSEYQVPLECKVYEACLGIPQTGDSTPGEKGFTSVDTANSCSEGYTGLRCEQCSSGYYVMLQRCYYCGSTTDQTLMIVATILVAQNLHLLATAKTAG